MKTTQTHPSYSHLLDLYFRGESTLAQEEQLRQYFQKGEILPEHLPYAPLFAYLEEERAQFAPLVSQTASNTHPFRTIGRFSKRLLFSGVAATVAAILLIGGGIFLNHKTNPDIYRLTIAGKQVNDQQLAVNIAKGKLEQLNSILYKMSERTEKAVTAATLPQQLNLLNRFSKIGNQDSPETN